MERGGGLEPLDIYGLSALPSVCAHSKQKSRHRFCAFSIQGASAFCVGRLRACEHQHRGNANAAYAGCRGRHAR